MWLISSKTFTNDSEQVQVAHRELNQAIENNSLTVVIGNSLTRFSYLLQAHKNSEPKEHLVGWERAVKRVLPELTPIADQLPFDNPTYHLDPFVIAQSVCARSLKARQKLLDQLNQELVPYTEPSPLHNLLVDLNPNAIVTTNYDLQIERAFARQHSNWEAIVRHAPRKQPRATPIYKLNGSLKPDADLESHYSFSHEYFSSDPDKTVLISGIDYDVCQSELRQAETSPIINALGQTLLIIGKSMSSLDLPFISALRMSKNVNRKAYYVSLGLPFLSNDDRLNLESLEITQLEINMPTVASNEHVYVGIAHALMNLFPDFGSKYRKIVDEFAQQQKLIGAPRFVAIGLAAHNTIGRLSYQGGSGVEKRGSEQRPIYDLPVQGRRNLRLDGEEYPGGSCLTALKTFTSLDTESAFETSIISILNENDLFGREILSFCESSKINTDGISRNGKHTWHSTVIVHDGESHRGIYPGQRIFMDRSFSDLTLEEPSLEQLEAQLHPNQSNLRLVYFDKFLAQPYRQGAQGALVEHQHILEKLIAHRSDVDLLYETGSGGSRGLVVERALNKYINILTAAFPFFARNILPNQSKSEGELAKFATDEFFFTAEFSHETKAIEEMLGFCGEKGTWFKAPSEWVEQGRIWAGRESSRNWLISTLHHYGALAIDLNTTQSIYCAPSRKYLPDEIESTVGAGDVFRGAFSYALTKLVDEFSGKTSKATLQLMRICTQFAVEIASHKCRHFKMGDAFANITTLGEKKLLQIKEEVTR